MENCELGSLKDYLELDERWNTDELRGIASCCLLGLAYLHSHNFSHGVFDCFTGK